MALPLYPKIKWRTKHINYSLTMQCILLPYWVEILNMVCLWYYLAYRSIQVPWHRWTLFIFIIVVTADTRLIYLFIFSAHVLLPRKTKITKKYNRCIFEADKGKYGCFHAGPGPSFSGSWPKGVSVYFYSLDFHHYTINFWSSFYWVSHSKRWSNFNFYNYHVILNIW